MDSWHERERTATFTFLRLQFAYDLAGTLRTLLTQPAFQIGEAPLFTLHLRLKGYQIGRQKKEAEKGKEDERPPLPHVLGLGRSHRELVLPPSA